MNIKECFRTMVGLSFRLIPFSTETGLRILGNPDENSPVFVTANFDLTVKRVIKDLRGLDCYLLVAPSKGINVWCAATGDSFNARSVISVIRTSRIGEKVNHRKLILPQLAAPGIDTKLVEEETEWRCEFGPVYARDIPEYVENGFKKTEEMRRVTFGLKDRLDVGLGCTFLGYLVFAALVLIFQLISGISWIVEFTIIGWSLLLLMYIFYPYTPGKTGWRKILSWEILIGVGFLVYLLIFRGDLSGYMVSLFVGAMVTTMLIGADFGGIAPITKSDFDPFMAKLGFSNWGYVMQFESARLDLIMGAQKISLDSEKCIGCGTCNDVCPLGVYRMDDEQGKSVIDDLSKCTACTACITQCPTGALFLKELEGIA